MEQKKSFTQEDRSKAWDYALGMIQIDGLTPTKEFLELVEKEKNGTITTEDIRRELNRKYHIKEEARAKNA